MLLQKRTQLGIGDTSIHRNTWSRTDQRAMSSEILKPAPKCQSFCSFFLLPPCSRVMSTPSFLAAFAILASDVLLLGAAPRFWGASRKSAPAMETCRWCHNLLVEVPLHNTQERLWQMVGMFSSQSAIPLKQCREPKTPATGGGRIESSSQFPSGSELWQIHTFYRSACQGAQMCWFSHNCLHLSNQFVILHHSVCPLVASWHDWHGASLADAAWFMEFFRFVFKVSRPILESKCTHSIAFNDNSVQRIRLKHPCLSICSTTQKRCIQ